MGFAMDYLLDEQYRKAMGYVKCNIAHAPVPGLRHPEAERLQRAVFRRRADPAHDRDRWPAALVPLECAEFPGRGGALGDDGADVGLFRPAPEDQCRRVRGILDLAQLSDRRMRQGLPALSQRTPAAALKAPAERNLRRALHDRFRGRRGPAGAPAGVLWGHPGLVVRRLSP